MRVTVGMIVGQIGAGRSIDDPRARQQTQTGLVVDSIGEYP
jgi:hypothetical protein